MNMEKINKATELLNEYADHVEFHSLEEDNFALVVYWRHGGQKVFVDFLEVLKWIEEHSGTLKGKIIKLKQINTVDISNISKNVVYSTAFVLLTSFVVLCVMFFTLMVLLFIIAQEVESKNVKLLWMSVVLVVFLIVLNRRIRQFAKKYKVQKQLEIFYDSYFYRMALTVPLAVFFITLFYMLYITDWSRHIGYDLTPFNWCWLY